MCGCKGSVYVCEIWNKASVQVMGIAHGGRVLQRVQGLGHIQA